ncbi:MAG: hypothetical protein ACP5UO_02465 [Thermoplasmata archaeon]
MAGNEFIEEYIRRFSEAVQNNAQAIDEFKTEIAKRGSAPQKVAVDLIRRYSGDVNKFFQAPPIGEIAEGYRGNILGTVSTLRCSEYERDGVKRTRCIGSLEDRTGRLPFTEFPEGSSRLSRGDLILIVNGYVGSFNGKPYLTISSRMEINVIERISRGDQGGELKVKDLRPDMYDVKIRGNLRFIEKTENVGKNQTTLYKGLLRDETGSISVQSWGVELKDGSVEIEGASVKQFNDRIYLHLGNGTKITYTTQFEMGEYRNLELLLNASRGIFRGEGVIIRILERSPVVEVCATCQRVVREGKCPSHPDSPVEKILRLSVILDDGYAAPLVYVYQKVLEKFVDGGKEGIAEAMKGGKEQELLRKIGEKILMKPILLSIYGFKGSNGNYLEIQDLEILEGDRLDEAYGKLLEVLR